jgi:hypothetical protein
MHCFVTVQLTSVVEAKGRTAVLTPLSPHSQLVILKFEVNRLAVWYTV